MHKWKTERNPSILNYTRVEENTSRLSPLPSREKVKVRASWRAFSLVENRQLAMAESQTQQNEEVSRCSNSTESSSDYGSASSSEKNGSAYLEPIEPELYEARFG